MLKKLIKHEWKSTFKTVFLMNVFFIALTVLGMITFASKFWSIDSPVVGALGGLGLITYYLTIFGISIAVVLYLYVHYFKTLYGDQGYLTHTLPVTNHELILSKSIVGGLHILITGVNIIICLVLLFLTCLYSIEPNASVELQNMWHEISTAFSQMATELNVNLAVYLVIGIILMIISCFIGSLTGLACVSLGQLFKKHKVMGSILSYIGIYFALQLVVSFAMIPFSYSLFDSLFDVAKFFNNMFILTAVTCIVEIIVLYFVSAYIMKKKINLD